MVEHAIANRMIISVCVLMDLMASIVKTVCNNRSSNAWVLSLCLVSKILMNVRTTLVTVDCVLMELPHTLATKVHWCSSPL